MIFGVGLGSRDGLNMHFENCISWGCSRASKMGESHGYFPSFLLQDVRGGEQDKAVLRADRGGLSAAGGRGHDVAGEHEEPARADAELPLLQRLLLELPLQDVHRDRPLHLALSHLLVSSRYRALKNVA